MSCPGTAFVFPEGFPEGCVPALSPVKIFMHARSLERWKMKPGEEDWEASPPPLSAVCQPCPGTQSAMLQRDSLAGRDQTPFLPNKHHSTPNVNLSPSLLLEEPHCLFSLWFADLCGNLVWKGTGHVATRSSRGETAPDRPVETHHIGH